ncbi:hypothetical protein ID866_397 [Astraeus odoratus]|nr:hypothetical protein ID866_397 [Astraeus odoratus]
MNAADYSWDDSDLARIHAGTSAVIVPSAPLPPSPSTCTSTSDKSPEPIVTHLPFTPGSSHTRNRKKGHIPRPPNAFMVFRSWLWNEDNLKNVERDNRNVSRIAGRYWNELSEEGRAPFRKMAEEAKARHAQLYPEYRYAPVFRKANKSAQRRAKRSSEDENARCKKVANLLLGGVQSSELAKYLDEESGDDSDDADDASVTASRTTITLPTASLKVTRKRKPTASRQKRARAAKDHRASVIEPTPGPLVPSPEIVQPKIEQMTPLYTFSPEPAYPLEDGEEFVATDDIPFLSLDDCCDKTPTECADLYSPPGVMAPANNTVLSGVKPEAIPFVDECTLTALNSYSSGPSTPFAIPTEHSFESLFSFDTAAYYSPVVFSNPFEKTGRSNERSPSLMTLDQLFGQSISPLTPIPSVVEYW